MDAVEAHRKAPPGNRVMGWLLPEADRARLLEHVPPRYDRVVAHHVTLRPRVAAAEGAMPDETAGTVVGVSDDGRGVQALVVRIAGTTQRPDGGTYHITWSLAPGRQPKESNDVIARHGWQPLESPVPVRLEPGLVG